MAGHAITKNLIKLTNAVSENPTVFTEIVSGCEQSGLITKNFKDALTEISPTTVFSKANHFISSIQTTVQFDPQHIDTFLAVLVKHGGVTCRKVAETIAIDCKKNGFSLLLYEKAFKELSSESIGTRPSPNSGHATVTDTGLSVHNDNKSEDVKEDLVKELLDEQKWYVEELEEKEKQLMQVKKELEHVKQEYNEELTHIKTIEDESREDIRQMRQKDLANKTNDMPASTDSLSIIHFLLSRELMKKTELIKDHMAEAITVILISIIIYQITGGSIVACMTVTAIIISGWLFISKLQVTFLLLMLMVIAYQSFVLLSLESTTIPVANSNNKISITHSLIGGHPDTINWLHKGFKMDIHPGSFTIDVPVNVTVTKLQPPCSFKNYPRVTQVYEIISTHQPSGEVLIHLKHNAIINKNANAANFFVLHQYNIDEFEMLTIRNLSAQFLTFAISSFSNISVILDPNKTTVPAIRKFYAMFYAKIHSGMVEVVIDISQPNEVKIINGTNYFKGCDSPIMITTDGETALTFEHTGCWKQENFTKIFDGINPDGEYRYYPNWDCWNSLSSSIDTWITVHFDSGKNAKNDPFRIFINPDINYPIIKYFKDIFKEIVGTFLAFIFLIVYFIILKLTKMLEFKYITPGIFAFICVACLLWHIKIEDVTITVKNVYNLYTAVKPFTA